MLRYSSGVPASRSQLGQELRVARWLFRSWIMIAFLLLIVAPAAPAASATARSRGAPPPPAVEAGVQAWLDAQPGRMKAYRDGKRSAAETIQGASSYYGLS